MDLGVLGVLEASVVKPVAGACEPRGFLATRMVESVLWGLLRRLPSAEKSLSPLSISLSPTLHSVQNQSSVIAGF